MPQPSVFKDIRACRLPALKRFKPFRRPFQGNWQQLSQPRPSHLFLMGSEPAVCPPSNASNPPQAFPRQLATTLAATPQPSAFKDFRACRLPALKRFKPLRRPFQGNWQQLSQPRPSHLFLRVASLPLAGPQTTCPSHLFSRTFEPAVCGRWKRFAGPQIWGSAAPGR